MLSIVVGWFEEYSVAYCCRLLGVGLRNIVVFVCCVFVCCVFVVCLFVCLL